MIDNQKKNYLSDIDKFLTDFDRKDESHSESKNKEIDKFNHVKKKEIKK